MKSAKILVSLILIPVLTVASAEGAADSVQTLLRKPRSGPARIVLSDGTSRDGYITWVTTQFLTLHDWNDWGACKNIGLPQVASIRWIPQQGDGLLQEILVGVLFFPLWIPMYIGYTLADREQTNDPLRGDWESTTAGPDGKIGRIEFGFENGATVVRQGSVAIEKGRYEVIGQDLHLTHEGSGLVETIPLQFDCESLVLGGQKLSTAYSTNRGRAPIVGRWVPRVNSHNSWEFTASGTLEKRIAESHIQGQIEKIKGGIRVEWSGLYAGNTEDWRIRTKGHHLFITAGGVTTEYVHAAD